MRLDNGRLVRAPLMEKKNEHIDAVIAGSTFDSAPRNESIDSARERAIGEKGSVEYDLCRASVEKYRRLNLSKKKKKGIKELRCDSNRV